MLVFFLITLLFLKRHQISESSGSGSLCIPKFLTVWLSTSLSILSISISLARFVSVVYVYKSIFILSVSPSTSNYISAFPCQPAFLSPFFSLCIQSISLSLSFPSPDFVFLYLDCVFSLYPIPFLTLHFSLSLCRNPNTSVPFSLSSCLRVSVPVSSTSQSLSCYISLFSRCLSPFVSEDRSVSLRAALWHGEMELVCSCSDGGTWQSG